MRPRRLREIFDDAGNVVVAFDQEHVAGRERLAQSVRIARRERLIAAHRLLKIAGDQLPEAIAHSAHDGSLGPLPARSRVTSRVCRAVWSRLCLDAFYWKSVAYWFTGARAVDRNLSVTFAQTPWFGQSAIPLQASGNHAAQGSRKNQPTLLPRHCRGACGAPGCRGHAAAGAGRD